MIRIIDYLPEKIEYQGTTPSGKFIFPPKPDGEDCSTNQWP